MKTRKKISARLLAIMFIAALLLPLAWNIPVEAAETKQIDVLFSHDTHSHLNSFSTIVDGEQKEVPDIDLIISGHTHSELKEAIQHGNTYIVSCGEYGRNLGSLSVTQKQDGRWN